MKFKFHPEALSEYISSIRYYSNISKSLALDFVTDIENSINQILEFPKSCNEINENIRKYVIKRFPYCIYYSIEQDSTIMIYAIMHTSQKPGYWKNRV